MELGAIVIFQNVILVRAHLNVGNRTMKHVRAQAFVKLMHVAERMTPDANATI